MKFLQLFVITSFLILSCIKTNAQSSAREIGVTTSAFQNFGFIYKKETKLNTFIRWKAAGLNITGVDARAAYNVGVSLGVAREKRRFFNEKFAFIHGLTGNLQLTSSFILNNSIRVNALPSIGYLLGVHYQILDDLYVNLEINPAFSVAMQADALGFQVNSYALRASSQLMGINLMYRFR